MTPEQTDLDALLVDFGQVLQRHSPEAADIIRYAYRQAKAKIEKLIVEARLDELQNMDTYRHYGKDYQDSLDELAEYKERRIRELTQPNVNDEEN